MKNKRHPRTRQRSKALRHYMPEGYYSYFSISNLEDYGLKDNSLKSLVI